jgi:hypothetical protein
MDKVQNQDGIGPATLDISKDNLQLLFTPIHQDCPGATPIRVKPGMMLSQMLSHGQETVIQ